MKRVGIVTFHHTTNYGGCLQAYSLVQFLRQNNCDAELIDYRPWRVHLRAELGSLISWSAVRWNLTRYDTFMGRVLSTPSVCMSHHFQVRRVLRFLREGSVLSDRMYFRRKALGRLATTYDCLITGSDEVWKIDKRRKDDWAYFLDFAGSGTKRVSYAASCGARKTFGE